MDQPQIEWTNVPTEPPSEGRKTGSSADVSHLLQAAATWVAQGRLEEAIAQFREAIDKNPDSPDAHHNLGVALAKQGSVDEAIAAFQAALNIKPDSVDTHRNLALAFTQCGKTHEALACLRRVVGQAPMSAKAHHELANALRTEKKFDESIEEYERALELEPDIAAAHHDLGLALAEAKRLDDAQRSYRRALELSPDFPEVQNNLGILLEELGDYDGAIALYRQALKLKPQSGDTLNNLGVALAAKRQFDEAIVEYEKALTINSDSPLALNNIGNSLRAVGRVTEAIAALQKAIRIKPEYAEAYNNLGIALSQEGRLDEAMSNYNRALYFRPDYPEAHLNRALGWLAKGDFANGWTEYEWRWKGKGITSRVYRQRRWEGSPLFGKSILLYFEQGVGDTLQFIRYAKVLKQQGATVIVEPQKPLLHLLAACPGIDQVVMQGDELPSFDFQAPLASLPGIVGTTLETIPDEVPYLVADPEAVAAWGERIGRRGFKIGICWQGNPQFRGDRQRSIPLRHFGCLARHHGVRLISLQKGFGTEQLQAATTIFAVETLDGIDEGVGAFNDLAAIIKNLDLVIACDTAIAHLAGGLGVPVWLALPYAADWRWLRHGDRTLWYPSMRLFRQPHPGAWSDVFDVISFELHRSLATDENTEDVTVTNERKSAAESHFQAANELAKGGDLERAVAEYETALQQDPMHPGICHNLGVVRARKGDLDLAIDSFKRSLELKPDSPDCHGNLGLAYYEKGAFQEAVRSFRRSLRYSAGSHETHNNLGVALVQLGRPADAATAYKRALQLKPDYADAHLNLARAMLSQGRLVEGFTEYEWRWKCPGWQIRGFRRPRWSGQALNGQTVLIHCEQGFGDTFQFVRYVCLVKQRGGRVLLECPQALVPIVRCAAGPDEVIARGSTLPTFDFHAPLMSLPGLLGTGLDNMPNKVPYLSADPALAEAWRLRLSQIDGYRIGLVWQGNPTFKGDRFRSFPLAHLKPVAALPDVQLINLQKGAGTEQLTGIESQFSIIDFGPDVDTRSGPFMDTAAILQHLNLVISCDTSVAHLAGALGIDTWLALPLVADWRWMQDREDSPWYPTVRLFRQRSAGGWNDLFDRIAAALREYLSTRRRPEVAPAMAGLNVEPQLNGIQPPLNAFRGKR